METVADGIASIPFWVFGMFVSLAHPSMGSKRLMNRSDVLSTVQSSIASGQDASQTLSRLMDWVEGREVS